MTTGMHELYDTDLLQIDNLARYNDGVRYLLIVIDVFSRFLYVEPIKNKTALRVSEALKKIFRSTTKPRVLRSDGGREYQNTEVDSCLKKEGIYHQTTLNQETKSNYAERVIKTLRGMLFRYFSKNRTYRYIDHLQDFVQTYNNTQHASLNGLAPAQINKTNQNKVWSHLYLKIKTRRVFKPF